MNIVAGSTMSASSAVSVMNCSCTATNRSSRMKPRRTRLVSGATVAGLLFWISIACTGGPSRSASRSPVSTLASRLMSRMRVAGSIASRPSISVLSQL